MKSVLEKLLKRQAYPVEIEGETLYVRGLTTGESFRASLLNERQRLMYAVGKCLCNPDGSDIYEQAKEETEIAYAARMTEVVDQFPQRMTQQLTTAISKVSKVPSPEDLQKN
jgi:hypothetical protein